jgi:hypothetical protein
VLLKRFVDQRRSPGDPEVSLFDSSNIETSVESSPLTEMTGNQCVQSSVDRAP